MKEIYKPSKIFRIIALALFLAGLGTMVYGFIADPGRTWASYLLNNFYFLSLAMGAAFFFVIQYISQSGWSVGFKRVPEAMMAYLPFAAVLFLLMYFGIHSLYHWSHSDAVATDELLQHKAPYLNTGFFMIRLVVYFALWVLLAEALRRFSRREDVAGGFENFHKSEFYSRVFIFILAITFTLAAFDWLMSLEPHWYSTIFALKFMVSAFLHGVSIMVLIIFLLHRKGYFPFLNKYHLHDFARYLFMLAIVWGYFWFAQFMLIWYANIPEETVYFVHRWKDGWQLLFFLEIGINWAVPFFVLLPIKASRNMTVISIVIVLLVIGQYIELHNHIMPETTGRLVPGFIEIAGFLGFAGLFALVVSYALGRANIVPVNHPFLEESKDHHF
jgi:hypothetical protein